MSLRTQPDCPTAPAPNPCHGSASGRAWRGAPGVVVSRSAAPVAQSEIGRVLAYAVPDPDGTAPPHAVRDLLERIGSDDTDDGLSIGIYNRHGGTSRGMFDGGDQERDLAAALREQAAGATAWPRTRRLLRRLADYYEREARDHDERAERRRRGLDG